MAQAFTLRSIALAASLAFSGCSAFNPYQRSEMLDNDVRPLRANSASESVQKTPDKSKELVGGLNEALGAVADQRNEWFGALSSHARLLNSASLAMLTTAGWGLYEGLKPGFAANGVASEASRKHVAKAGIGTAGFYALGNLFLNTKHDEAYVEGFKSLTCLMVRARPYAMTGDERGALTEALGTLETKIAALDGRALTLRHVDGLDTRARSAQQNRSTRALVAAESALRTARLTHERASQLGHEVDLSGSYLRRQAELVTAAVAEEIRRTNNDLRSPDQLLADLQAVTGKFQAIEPPERDSEEAKDEAEPDKGTVPASPPDADPAAPATKKEVASLARTLGQQLADLQEAIVDPKAAKAKKAAAAAKAALASAAPPKLPTNAELGEGKLKPLVTGIADLYTERRRVNSFLVVHKESVRRVKEVKECRGGPASTLVIVPSEDKAVERDGAYRFNISGSKGLPVVSLDGNAGSQFKAGARALVVSLEGGVAVALVTIGGDAPEGKLRLLVHDPATRAVEDVVLSVPKPAPAGK
jgi:hypothetical protein